MNYIYDRACILKMNVIKLGKASGTNNTSLKAPANSLAVDTAIIEASLKG